MCAACAYRRLAFGIGVGVSGFVLLSEWGDRVRSLGTPVWGLDLRVRIGVYD